jgi:molybdopterin-guanine dinucleotide biosynthesis protein A
VSGVSAIVLAGGRSSRFGRDKLTVPVGGVPLLARAVVTTAEVADEIVVVLAPDATAPPLPISVIVAHDPQPFGGPLIGVVAGLEIASHDLVVVVGGDMPTLVPDLLWSMIDRLADHDAAVLLERGERRSLPMAVRRDPALAAGRDALAAGRRSLLAVTDRLEVDAIDEAVWRPIDPDGRSLVDVDRPADV